MANTTTAKAGPWDGVNDSIEPYDDTPNTLVDALNGYIPDPTARSGFYARPGFAQPNPLYTGGGNGGAVYTITDTVSGTTFDFYIANNKLWRQPTTSAGNFPATPVDVTPTNITISQNNALNGVQGNFCFFSYLGGNLLVSDGSNKPWMGTNLGATPITGQTIDYQSPINYNSRGSTDTKIASIALSYTVPGSPAILTKVAVPTGTMLPAGTIPLNTWGIYRSSINAAGTITITAGAANFTTGYATEVLAIAAIPALPAASWDMGATTVLTKVGTTFVGGTDALAGGASGNVATTTNYYAGDSIPWAAFGNIGIYVGSAFFILRHVAGVLDQRSIVWCEPNQPNVGYQQLNYADFWTLTQTSTESLYALAPTNQTMYYARAQSWGAASGIPSIAFSANATHDSVSYNIGTMSPASVQQFGNYIYFLDMMGRPWRFVHGGAPEPLWLQMRASFDTAQQAGLSAATIVARTAWGVIEPTLNLYICAPWPSTIAPLSPTTLRVFDAQTGKYFGRWQVGGAQQIEVGGILTDSAGQKRLVLLGGKAGSLGYIWCLTRPNAATADILWQDDSTTVPVNIQSQRLGFSIGTSWLCAEVRALEGNQGTPMTCSTLTPFGAVALPAQSPVGNSADETFRVTWTPEIVVGRGLQCTIAPTTTTTQWVLFGLEADLVGSKATITEP